MRRRRRRSTVTERKVGTVVVGGRRWEACFVACSWRSSGVQPAVV
jgi:hypothetical protein